jgi:hypothetical protein
MATAVEILDVNMIANSDLSAKQFFLVKQTGTVDKVDLVAANTDRTMGPLTNAPKSGQAASVQKLGIAKVVSDGSGTAIAAGDVLAADSSGRVVKNATADRLCVGTAMDASTTAGAVIRVDLGILGTPFRTPA